MARLFSITALVSLLSLASADTPSKIEARATSATSTGPASLPTITMKGNAFFNGTDRFYIRGVDYQPGGSSEASDPLADYSTCSRDIPYFQKLGLNTIRVYTADNSKNHDQCMNALAEATLDVNTPNYSLNRASPGVSYNPTYLQSIFATIDAFAAYSNTLLFFSGNEVINAQNSTTTAPYVKAVTRDMRQYITERGYRSIPVGYSAADVSENQYLMAQYMDCGREASRSDFYAINNYEWCDPSSFTQAGWDVLVQQYSNYSLPLFLSEYGSFSGGLVYEYSEEGNGYGIVSISGNTVTPVDSQFSDLQSALSSTPNPTDGGGYSTNGTIQDCPGQSDDWDTSPFTGSALPATPSGALKYFQDGAGAGPGLSGAGSQDASGGSSSTASANAGMATTTYASGSSSTAGSSAASAASSSSAAVAGRLGEVDGGVLVCGMVTMAGVAAGFALL